MPEADEVVKGRIAAEHLRGSVELYVQHFPRFLCLGEVGEVDVRAAIEESREDLLRVWCGPEWQTVVRIHSASYRPLIVSINALIVSGSSTPNGGSAAFHSPSAVAYFPFWLCRRLVACR